MRLTLHDSVDRTYLVPILGTRNVVRVTGPPDQRVAARVGWQPFVPETAAMAVGPSAVLSR